MLDVNYRGSTGFGAYRDRLHLGWGVVDVDDCVSGAEFLAPGLVDGQRFASSAAAAPAAHTALAALAFRDFFQGGASYYGISDSPLARDTPKFESRYLDWLIGPIRRRKRATASARRFITRIGWESR